MNNKPHMPHIPEDRVISPFISLAGLLIVAISLALISVWIFWGSETRQTVQYLQQVRSSYDQVDIQAEELNDDGKLSVQELKYIQQNLSQQTAGLSPDSDFQTQAIDKDSLGY